MELKWKQCESLLMRMAESLGFMIIVIPANSLRSATWHVAKRRGNCVFRVTLSYFSPKELFDKFLHHYYVFNARPGVVRNPFYGMSPEEAELRLAVIGAQPYGRKRS